MMGPGTEQNGDDERHPKQRTKPTRTEQVGEARLLPPLSLRTSRIAARRQRSSFFFQIGLLVSLLVVVLPLFLLEVVAEGTAPKCVLTAKRCENFPGLANGQFRDKYGEDLLGLKNPSACIRRAEDFHHWCGNGRDSDRAAVGASWMPTGDTQIYHPTACDEGWSLYQGNCYIHMWRAKTWWEAEQWCNTHGANLCSIHGKAENEFVFTLTKGLSSWIGYHDTDQDEKHEWSDNSKTDFDNMAKNCTGRETEPDCAPEETAQQWYDWRGEDRGTWVCKKKAKWGLRLMRNTTDLVALSQMDWETLKTPIEELPAPVPASKADAEEVAAPKPVRKKAVELGGKKKEKQCVKGKC